jgi:cellulose synthase/poly-beta-1,6-N-acetylglucosamine synthase-like glycosyltransferase
MLVGDWILIAFALLVAIPFATLAVESLASLLPVSRRSLPDERPACAILVPAHNEEAGIAATIRNLLPQLAPGDRIVVVADNCTDATEAVARTAGADVVNRSDPVRRGKGFALDFGLGHLAENPPAIVVVVDADCELSSGCLDALVRQVAATNRPAQGVYLIGTGQELDPRRRLSAFAVLLKNQIRPLGLHRLGFPCLLTGTGMAFPWEVIRAAHVGTGNIVEDMKLGVDLALAGQPPRLCVDANLYGAAAPDRSSAIQQRTRWEHGHVQTMLTQAPRLLLAGLLQLRCGFFALGLELAIPPLSLLILGWLFLTAICLLWWQVLGGSAVPVTVSFGSVVLAGCAVLLAWFKHGRKLLPVSTLLLAPVYVLWKVPIYLKLLVTREKRWHRTQRRI